MIRKKDLYKEVSSLTVSHKTRVRFNETDALGIVWHGNYLIYFEDAREAFGRKYGISYLDMLHAGYATPIVASSCSHKLMLKYGELIRIEATYVATPAAKIVFHYKIYNEEEQLVCTGETIQVFLDKQNNLSLAIPSFYETWKKELNLL